MSRADQSLRRTTPNMRSSASLTERVRPVRVRVLVRDWIFVLFVLWVFFLHARAQLA
jgi:hypothetical protein